MLNPLGLVLVLSLVASPTQSAPPPGCEAPAMSDQQVKDAVAMQRASRKDLPAPFPQYRTVIQRQRCYYVYIEYALPEAPDHNYIFKLNQYGIIVDVDPASMKCPDK